ncbi:energy-coupling factor transporter transmembrane component T [uncultured Arcobacter sp.]|uniref:energy-coupling factor transporter transmembrane component T family protein n=1 Tax=uncultured Arcobacter sp. TaxID=165434 RepID=UPI002617F787|nr:energy-coupling factor transporter transmembrane component T [uncultured Arcobacter sp.]
MKESLKLINSFLYSFVVAFSSLHYIFLLPLIIVLFMERESFFQIIKKLVLLNTFILVLVFFVYFQNSSEAFSLLIRTNLILLFNITLFYKSKGYDIVRGLDSLSFPPKIVSVFYFTLSLITFLTKDFKETKNTLKARGFVSNTSIFTYQTYGNIFGMIFIKALKKSEDMKLSMKARGFKDRIFFINSNKIILFEKVLSCTIIVVLLKVGYELFN